MRKLHSNEHTTVTKCQCPTQDSLRLSSVPPHPSLYTTDFNRLSAKPPFHISVAGIVSSVKPVCESSGSVDMQEFRLHDRQGRYVMCRAFGRHAGSSLIVDGADIIMYFAIARPGLSNQSGSLWLFDDSHVLALGMDCEIPTARQFIELRV